MPRRNKKKQQKRSRSSFKHAKEPDDKSEKCLHESMTAVNKKDFTPKSSIGSSAVMRKLSRELSEHKSLLQRKFESALNGTGAWRDKPDALRILSELRAVAIKNGER